MNRTKCVVKVVARVEEVTHKKKREGEIFGLSGHHHHHHHHWERIRRRTEKSVNIRFEMYYNDGGGGSSGGDRQEE